MKYNLERGVEEMNDYEEVLGNPKQYGAYWVELSLQDDLAIWSIWWWRGSKWKMPGYDKGKRVLRVFGPIPLPEERGFRERTQRLPEVNPLGRWGAGSP